MKSSKMKTSFAMQINELKEFLKKFNFYVYATSFFSQQSCEEEGEVFGEGS